MYVVSKIRNNKTKKEKEKNRKITTSKFQSSSPMTSPTETVF